MTTALALYSPMEQIEIGNGVFKFAQSICDTDFVPAAFRGNVAAVTACMMKGSELGIPLMQSLAHIHVIKGKVGTSAELQRGLALAHGHEIEIVETTDTRCVIQGKRVGSETWQKFVRTIEWAKTAGLMSNPAWKNFPADMLLARASSAMCRAMFADAIGGMSYTVEELQDIDEGAATVDAALEAPKPAPKQATARARQAATRGAAASTPDAPVEQPTPVRGERPPLPGEEDIIDAEIVADDAPADEPPVDTGSTMTGPARIAMLMNEHGVKDRDEKLRAVSRVVGRPVKSSKDLTYAEQGQVIEFMNGLSEGELFPFDVVGEGVVAPGPLPDAKAADSATSAAPPPPRDLDPDDDPEEWDSARWRRFAEENGLKPSDLAKQIKASGCSGWDDVCGSGKAAGLVAWVLAQAPT